MSNEEIHQLREWLSTIGNESGGSDVNLLPARYREPWGVGREPEPWSGEPSSTDLMSNEEIEQLRERLINMGNDSGESGRESGGQGGNSGGHGDGNGGGDGGNRGVHDGYQSESDEDDKNGASDAKAQKTFEEQLRDHIADGQDIIHQKSCKELGDLLDRLGKDELTKIYVHDIKLQDVVDLI